MKNISIIVAVGLLAAALMVSCTTTGPKPAAAKPATASPAPAAGGAGSPAGKNIALGKTAKSNNHIYEFTADKAVDGDVNTYYEGAAKNYPNDLVVDLGAPKNIHGIAIKLNPKRIWSQRSQTFEILVSDDGENFVSAVAAKAYDFNPTANQNSINAAFEAKGRYLKISFTANSESTGGQAAELEIYGE